MIFRFLAALITFSVFAYSQDAVPKDQSNLERGKKIIEDARRAIGFTSPISKYKSFYIKRKVTSSLGSKTENVTEETSIQFPDKYLKLYTSIDTNRESKFSSLWNSGRYKIIMDAVNGGKRSITDLTKGEPYELLKMIYGEKEAKKQIEDQDSRKFSFFDQLSTEVFPLVFSHILEPGLEFEYLGTVETGKVKADAVGFKSVSGHSYQMFFDKESHHLILQKENFHFSSGSSERSYYFSNYKKFDNILVPTEIKMENIVTLTNKKEPLITNDYFDILEFRVNPAFNPQIFQVE